VSGGDRRKVSVRGDEGRSPRANTSLQRMEQRFWLKPRAISPAVELHRYVASARAVPSQDCWWRGAGGCG
jgi:hypothetical protein